MIVHHFSYRPDVRNPASVNVAGDFNGWNTTADPMTRSADGSYAIDIPLTPGVHFYKFVVNGNQWKNDPASDAELEEPDTYGGKNSAVLIGPDGRKLPPPQPGAVEREGLKHDPADGGDVDVVSDHEVRLALRTRAGNMDAVELVSQDAKGQWSAAPTFRVASRLGFDSYATAADVGAPELHYYFRLKTGQTVGYYGGGEVVNSEADAQSHAFSCKMTPIFQTPEWAKHAVWYQIFPERFRNGDPSNDPEGTQRWTSNWWTTLPGESGQFYKDVWKRRYGGDFQGIIQELPYLRELGITAIYLNPIFKAEDLHKYDTSDYRHVDDHFGFKGDIDQLQGETDDPATWQWTRTDKLFLQFVAEAHKQGFKVILDGVFNHVGKQMYAFQDVVKNGKASRYASWFDITQWGPDGKMLHYNAWDGPDGWLPALKKDPKLGLVHGPRELVMAVTKRWLAPDGDASKGVDGFRLDVAEGIPHPFWTDWRKLVKETKPDALIVGEIWSVAPQWLSGDAFDATMDYPFAMACQSFFVDQRMAWPPSQFGARLEQLIMGYPFQVSLVEQNLLDSHDMDRWASRFVNPDRPFDGANRIQDNGPDYSPAKPNDEQWARMRQSLVVQMTYVGAPMIYYGDEAGMWSPDDPSNREPMVWKDLEPYDDPQVKFNDDLFRYYQKLIAIRQALPELQTGFAHNVLTEDGRGVIAIERDLGAQHACVVINRSKMGQTIRVPFGASDRDERLVNWMDDRETKVNDAAQGDDARPVISAVSGANGLVAHHGIATITLPPWGSAVLTETGKP